MKGRRKGGKEGERREGERKKEEAKMNSVMEREGKKDKRKIS